MCTAAVIAIGLSMLCDWGNSKAAPPPLHPSPRDVKLAENIHPDGPSYHMLIEIGRTERLDLVLPANFGLGYYEGSTMEFTKSPETVDNWSVLISMMAIQHYTGKLTALRSSITNDFFKSCKTKNELTAKYPLREKSGNTIMDWVVSCDLIVSGPSQGKPETTLYHYMSGKESDVVATVGLRWIPTAKDIEVWKSFLDQSTLSSR